MLHNEFMSIVSEVGQLIEAKSEDYQNDAELEEYFPFGDLSYIQMLWTKMLRLKSIAALDSPNFEATEDTLNDLIAYAVFYKQYLNEQTS